ncbi:MAG: leucine-rich repeat domain-containing protein [Bacteroidales bacterium]|nr:leucine-rich repeat domain-containing protein [Bacteroidales bacterium]
MKRIVFFLCTLLCANVLLAQDFWNGTLHYYIANGTATVYGYDYSAHPTNIVIPSTVTYEGITYSVTAIGDYAFEDCWNLTTITIPNSVTAIGWYAFNGCSALTTVTIPYSVTFIGDYAFNGCSALTSVYIPNSVTSIGDYAFTSCWSLTSVTIPNSVTSFGDYAFGWCHSLTSVTIGNSVTSIGDYAFYNCESLTSLTIGNSVTSIGGSAFQNCSSLTSVTIPNSVTSIGQYAFGWCSSLTSVTIPNSVTSIGKSAFKGCSSLTTVTIGNSVTSIGGSAFGGCSSLQNVTCLATTPPTLKDNNVFPNPNTATLTVPCGTLEAYYTSDWSMFFLGRIEEDCSGLEDAEFAELSVYPNPTRGKVSLSQAIEKIEVIDLSGKTLQTYENANEINIEALPAGVYHLRLTIEDKTTTRKVIKE